MTLLELDFMRRALLAAALVGLVAPAVGVYLAQRRLALLGDGIGHITLAGVAAGFSSASRRSRPRSSRRSSARASSLLRSRGGASGEVALAAVFYGGLATGVLLIGLKRTGSANLFSYLFGSVTTVSPGDLKVIVALTVGVLVVLVAVRRLLFAVTYDEEVAEVVGLPVTAMNLLVAIAAALTVALAMRVVGVLLVSALMVLPVAAAGQLARSFRGAVAIAMTLGTSAAVIGLVCAYYWDVAPGATIVLLALAAFLVAIPIGRVRT